MIYKLQDGNTLPSLQSIQRLKKRNEPKEDAWEKEKQRIQKQTDKIKQENSWMGKTADALHHIGVGATGLGLLGSFVAAPVATALGLAGGISGEKLVNKGLSKLADITGSRVRSWNDLTSKYLGWSPTLQMLTNPGTLLGGAVGGKAGSAIQKRIPVHLDRDATGNWTGWINIGNRQIRPSLNTLSANIPKLESRVIVQGRKTQTGKKFDDILESDIPKLKEMILNNQVKKMQFKNMQTKNMEDVEMIILDNKQPLRKDIAMQLVEKYDPELKAFQREYDNPILSEESKSELTKAKKLYKSIKDKYTKELDELNNKVKADNNGSGIDWNWYNQGILGESNIPVKVATSPVYDPRAGGIIDQRSLMERFYQNILNNEGIIQKTQKYLIDKGIIVPYEGKWVYQAPGRESRELIDPSRFILNWILENVLKSTNRVPFLRRPEQQGTLIPYHSTPIGDKSLTRVFSDPSKRTLFTSVDDGSKGFSPLTQAYKKTKFGTSIPVATKAQPIEFEEPLVSENGLHGSNNFGEVGELLGYFDKLGGRTRKVIDVSDSRNIKGNTGQRQNEYNFGPGVPDIMSLLHTFDFYKGAGPFIGYKKGGKLR